MNRHARLACDGVEHRMGCFARVEDVKKSACDQIFRSGERSKGRPQRKQISRTLLSAASRVEKT